MHCYFREIPEKKYHRFVSSLIPPKMGPIKNGVKRSLQTSWRTGYFPDYGNGPWSNTVDGWNPIPNPPGMVLKPYK